MQLYYDHNDSMVRFGVEHIRNSLKQKGIEFVESFITYGSLVLPKNGIVIRKITGKKGNPAPYADQAFKIYSDEDSIHIEASDSRGLMYGCLEWAERILLDQTSLREPIEQSPAIGIRGIKYNLPYAPFDSGDPFVENEETCLDINYWKAFIDMLARHRYNCLSLWSEHPYHLMVVSSKYRSTNPYTDIEIDRNIRFFRQLFQYATDRGVDVYLFTWNIRLIPQAAVGLGLPENVGDFGNMYDHLIHRVGLPLNRFRSQSDLIRDYIKEMVLQLLLTYPELKGLGTSASEWMDGDGYEREAWIVDTYLEAINQSGRDIPFIHRTNMQNAGKEIKEMIMPHIKPEKFYISWKYSNAHCYSHPRPQFEKLWKAWEGIDLDETQVLYTVRNDDVFTHRWGDPEYIRDYVRGMLKPYVKGFYWGADGYVWGKDFQHIDYGHKTWTYDFERHQFQFLLWGRLSYNPDVKPEVWVLSLQEHYDREHAPLFLEGLSSASKVIPAVNRLFWIDYDFQWHPESCLSEVSGFKTILDFVDAAPMPGVNVMSLRQYAEAEADLISGTIVIQSYDETPIDILRQLEQAADRTERVVKQLHAGLGELCGGHAECTLSDLQAYAEMARYYYCKFSAALSLNRYRVSGSLVHREHAVEALQQGVKHWDKLGRYWASHNKPYFMARVKHTFGYPFYRRDVLADIELARQFTIDAEVKTDGILS
ncbi:hypothetical protein ACFP56_17220 [Paenibacillus septentrionalis]|uniref:Alpha glucuronidase N-terminal domain-containing protein n=1 Tax=Paenibacillus septentrionalis TaxID=429342 RepID=A0ABW1V809_9BACL